jgi:hypothetical protein
MHWPTIQMSVFSVLPFARIEQNRLDWARHNQVHLRGERYHGMCYAAFRFKRNFSLRIFVLDGKVTKVTIGSQ